MYVGGLQKLSLVDFPDNLAATIFLNGCNFRCPFCHNAGLVLPSQLQNNYCIEDVLDFLKTRKGKLDGICITGGEPLINKDILDLIAPIKEMGFNVKLDTNGSFPDLLLKIIDSGLIDYVAMDIKNSKEKYPLTVGIENYDVKPICESVEILKSDIIDYEFRTTVVNELHDKDDFVSIGEWINGAKRYFLQTFVDSGNLINGSSLSAPSKAEIEAFASIMRGYTQYVGIRG